MLIRHSKTIFSTADGAARIEASDRAVGEIKKAATPPAACGPAVVVAPARSFRVTDPVGMVPKGADEWQAQPIGYRGRSVMVTCDVFDQMQAGEMARCQREKVAYVPPFTPGQIAVGRAYRDLVERHEASGMRCSQLDGSRRGGGGSAGVTEAQLQDARQIASWRRRIGSGVALEVRRIRPSKRGEDARGPIRDRVLVDMVCIAGSTLSEVLRAHGWSQKGEHREALRKALAAILERMRS